MSSKNELRRTRVDEVVRLSAFFSKAYGPSSVFTNHDYLLQYFMGEEEGLNSFIAVCDGEIAAHYGVRVQNFIWKNKEVKVAWGVNAFTDPDYRGKNFGKGLLALIMGEYPIVGVIGFTAKAAGFYEALGFNLFNRLRFSRWVLPLRPEFFKAVEAVGGNIEEIKLKVGCIPSHPQRIRDPFRLTSLPMNLKIHMPKEVDFTFSRTLKELRSRFNDNLGLSYEFYYPRENSKALLVARREELVPLNGWATRIVDLVGDEVGAEASVAQCVASAFSRDDWYIEFARWGSSAYDSLLAKFGFILLEGDECSWIPQVSSPVQYKLNNEYCGIWSSGESLNAFELQPQKIYLTRAASDRDRMSRKK